jgi:hypothetical protein
MLHVESYKRGKTRMSERDIHFHNAAELLTTEVYHRFGHFIGSEDADQDENVEQGLRLLFAQFAYDLVLYALSNVDTYELDYRPQAEYERSIIPTIPDLTEWPE